MATDKDLKIDLNTQTHWTKLPNYQDNVLDQAINSKTKSVHCKKSQIKPKSKR